MHLADTDLGDSTPPTLDTESNDERGAGPTRATARRERIGRYVLLQPIGVGGMGEVYLAHDPVLGRAVAIKLVRSDRSDPASQTRIIREGRALARLSHPNVVAVHEANVSAGQIFLVMEYVKGITLRRFIADERPIPALIDMFLQAGHGLAAAHRVGLVHRDFKPDNVLIGEDGRARVVDFGLVADPSGRDDAASANGQAAAVVEPRLTVTGALPGTPAYMAPEQFMGRRADARSDQFSFCVALHEALCGERPFAGATALDLRIAALAGAIRPPRRRVPEWLLAVVRRGLSPDPDARWPSIDALLAALERDPIAARDRRIRLAALLLAVALAVALVVLGVGELARAWQSERREQEAAARVAAVNERIVASRERGDREAAARIFAELVEDPRVRESTAFAGAWLDEAGRRWSDEDLDAAGAAYAEGFVHARSRALELAALDGLSQVFHAQQRWGALGEVLAAIERAAPGAAGAGGRRELALASALGQRDLDRARGLLLSEGPSSARRLLDRLAGPARELEFDELPEVHGLDRPLDLEGDGALELLLRPRAAAGARLDVVRRDPRLTLSARLEDAGPGGPLDLLVPLAPDRDGRLLLLGARRTGAQNYNLILRPSASGQLVPTHAWPDAAAWAVGVGDLDGDGVDEVYFGPGPDSRRLLELIERPGGGHDTRMPIAPGDEPESDIQDLLVIDLDGDGRRELVMATGPWQAYDVRVYRRGDDGLLRLVDRDMLGMVCAVRPFRLGGELLLAASHAANFPSGVMFPPARPAGEPPGAYLLRLRDDRLERVRYLPLPPALHERTVFVGLANTADLDGDGRDDLALAAQGAAGRDTVFFLQEADGEFTSLLLGQTSYLGAVELDGDPEPESLVILGPDGNSGRMWIVGAGDQRLPAAPGVGSDLHDHVLQDMSEWSHDWGRARELRSMGLHASAAEVFDRIAADTLAPEDRGRALLAAAREHELAGGLARAAERFERAAEHSALAEEAARGAYRARLRLGDHGGAAAALAALLRLSGLSDREALAREHARLRPIAEGQAQTTVTFAGPLAAGWTIHDPLALSRDSGAETLDIDTARSSVLAELPVEVAAGPVALTLDMTLELLEYGANLNVELVPEGGERPLLSLWASASGGGRHVRRIFQCVFGHRRVAPRSGDLVFDSANVERVTLRAASILSLAERVCALERRGEETLVDVARDQVTPSEVPPGRYRLVLRSIAGDGPARLRARLHRLTLTGARALAPTDAGEDQPLAHALVEGAYATARELAAASTGDSPARRAWTIDLLLRSGQSADARAELAALMRAAEEDPAAADVLSALLRRDPNLYGPVLWSVDAAAFLTQFRRAWALAARQHIDEPRVPRALLDVLGRVDPAALAGPDAPAGQRELAVTLLTWRALALLRVRRPEEARRDLRRALEWAGSLDDPRGVARRDLLVELAALEAASGDVAAARASIDAALAVAVNRTAAADMLRARPELASLMPAARAPGRD